MINEEMNKMIEEVSEEYPETLLEDKKSANSKREKPVAEELSKEEKRLEKLNSLKEKYGKAKTAQEAAEKKTSALNAQIAKIEKEIHAEEDNRLMAACKRKEITYPELADFIEKIPDNKKLSDLL